MRPSKILIIPSYDDEESFELEIHKHVNGINDYKFKHKRWVAFQYDDHDRPSDFKEEYVKEHSFRGYLIGKRIKGVNDIWEVRIKVIE
jgi:hypothetical protein